MSEPVRLCKDCRWYRRRWYQDTGTAQCAQPSVASPVDGSPILYCQSLRYEHSRCGPGGKLFESKEEPAPDGGIGFPL